MRAACLVFPVVLLLGLELAAAGEVTACKNVNLVRMTGNRVIPKQTVIVPDGRILEIGTSREATTTVTTSERLCW